MNKVLISEQYEELQKQYKYIHISFDENKATITGYFEFIATYKNKAQEVKGKYNLLINIPPNYPNQLPTVKELDGEIEEEYHHFTNGTLCLGVRIDLFVKFQKQPTLLGFVENLVIPYLFNYYIFKNNGTLPFGQRSHNEKGIIEYYQEVFETKDKLSTLQLLTYLINDKFEGKHMCPCKKGRKIENCHGSLILEYRQKNLKFQFQSDYYKIIKTIKNAKRIIPKYFYLKEVIQIFSNNYKRCNNEKK